MALEFVHIARKAGFSPNAHILGLMGTLIRNILDLNDLDAVDVASTAAADMMLLIDDLNHEQSDLISEFVQCAKSTVSRANISLHSGKVLLLLSNAPNLVEQAELTLLG
jgi:tubulin-specific chaperone D